MEFKEFREFDNPERADYDIISSLKEKGSKGRNEVKTLTKEAAAFTELYFDLRVPESFELEPFGITERELEHPTKETIEKLKRYAESFQKINTHKSG